MKPIIKRILPISCRSLAATLFSMAVLVGCGGGSGDSDTGVDTGPPDNPVDISGCIGFCADENSFLTVADVQKVISQAVAEATALGTAATIAVVDRVGNVLAVFRMPGANNSAASIDPRFGAIENFGFVTVTSGRTPRVQGGLENLQVVPDTLASIAKAVTGAFLSSEGNAFTTRTANQIVQEHFNPGEIGQPGGPLFGVQFSSMPCSDLNRQFGVAGDGMLGPKRTPLGLSADSGGLPLYKAGTPVGAVGVISDGIYGLDLNIGNLDRDNDELIATAATFGFAAPVSRRADRIAVDGKIFRFSDVDFGDLASAPESAPDFGTGVNNVLGQLVAVRGYFDGAIIRGTAFGQPESGIAPADPNQFPDLDGFVLVNADGSNRFPAIAGTQLTAGEVQEVLKSALAVANRTRAQIRQPASTQMRATISVVDTNGDILGIVRTRDAPVFGTDVSLQKARTAVFFSNPIAAGRLNSVALPACYLPSNVVPSLPLDQLPLDLNTVIQALTVGVGGQPPLCLPTSVPIGSYVDATRAFLGSPTALADGAVAFSDRAGGNLARPFFPDGIKGNPNGPLSKAFDSWSPFTDGLQLDLSLNQILLHVLFTLGVLADDPGAGENCTGVPELANGIQIFPGSVPIYKGDVLAGGIGISGDGVDQDDMIAFLGVHNAGLTLGTVNNAPKEIRADQIEIPGFDNSLRYVQCPQAPFLDSDEQDPCNGK